MAVDDRDQLIGLIYEAALDPALWPSVLGRITRASRASCSLILALEPATARPMHVLFDAWPGYDDYLAHYVDIDPRNACGARLPAGAKMVDYTFTTEREMARSEFYQDYLLPNGVGYVGAKVLMKDQDCCGGIALQRSRRQGPFELRELELLDALAPHLLRALRLQMRFAELETQRWADETLRDRLPFAVILVDAAGRIVGRNAAATLLLATGDGLAERHHRLVASHPADQAALEKALCDAVISDRQGAVGATVALRRPSLQRPLGAHVMPIPRVSRAFSLGPGEASPAGLVVISDPETLPQAPTAALQRLYGLTPAEAALAGALVADKSLHAYADEAGVTHETARWRLKQVLAKTGTHRQAELVRLLVTSAVLD